MAALPVPGQGQWTLGDQLPDPPAKGDSPAKETKVPVHSHRRRKPVGQLSCDWDCWCAVASWALRTLSGTARGGIAKLEMNMRPRAVQSLPQSLGFQWLLPQPPLKGF